MAERVIGQQPAPALPVQPFAWGPDVVLQVFAACLTVPAFYVRARSCLLPEYFPDAGQASVLQVVSDFAERYGDVPAEPMLRVEVTNAYKAGTAKEQAAHRALDAGYATRPTQITWLSEKVRDFGRHQAMMRACQIAAASAAAGLYDDALAAISSAHAVGLGDEGSERWYVAGRSERAASRQIPRPGIGTGFQFVDTALDGGCKPGELYCLMADAKAGKTTYLLNVAAHQALCGRRCVYYTLEVGADIVEDRIDCRLMGVNRQYLRAYPGKTSVRLDAIAHTCGTGEVVTKRYPSGSATIGTIKSHLRYLRDAHGYVPDLVVIDYLDLVKPSRKRDKEYQELDDTASAMRAMSVELSVPIWTVTQTNREGGVSRSYGKVAIVDAMFELVRPADRDSIRELRARWVRNGPGDGSIDLMCDLDTYTLRPVTDAGWQQATYTSPPGGMP